MKTSPTDAANTCGLICCLCCKDDSAQSGSQAYRSFLTLFDFALKPGGLYFIPEDFPNSWELPLKYREAGCVGLCAIIKCTEDDSDCP